MRKLQYIFLVSLLLGQVGVGFLSAQDYARMTERTIMGTARYVGFGGAMSAIGGDPSAVRDNVAGLGLYRRTELILTLDYAYDRTWQKGIEGIQNTHLFMAPEASLVLSLPILKADEQGILAHNFMFSYHRLQSYARRIDASGDTVPSMGNLFASTGADLGIAYCTDRTAKANYLTLKESGYANEYGIDWSMNISNRWYVGLGLRVQSYMLSSDADYEETFSQVSATGKLYYNRNQTRVIYSGASFNLSAGFIYRPVSWFRLGFGLQTPSLGSLNISSSGELTAQTDSLRSSRAPYKGDTFSDFHQPLHLSSSAAFQIGYYGLIAFQYDYYHQKDEADIHSLRAGLEIIPVPGMYINAGYVYESTFKRQDKMVPVDPTLDRQDAYFMRPRWSQYASIALGYRGKYAIVQAAYQYRWQGINMYAHEAADPYDIRTNTHRVVVTIGWHRY